MLKTRKELVERINSEEGNTWYPKTGMKFWTELADGEEEKRVFVTIGYCKFVLYEHCNEIKDFILNIPSFPKLDALETVFKDWRTLADFFGVSEDGYNEEAVTIDQEKPQEETFRKTDLELSESQGMVKAYENILFKKKLIVE